VGERQRDYDRNPSCVFHCFALVSPSSDGLLNCGKVVCVEPPLLRRQPIRRA
jgi:hypothetical protein